MKQLALGIGLDAELGLDDSVAGRNVELHQTLRQMLAGTGPERLVYVWGAPGSGRTHTLRACEVEGRRGGQTVHRWDGRSSVPSGASLLLVDDVDRLGASEQIELFHEINRIRDAGYGRMIVAGSTPPASLELREDLRTRLGAGLVFQLHPLTDEQKTVALSRHARARGLDMPEDVARYLLTHSDRDLRALLQTLDRLDRGALERQRPLTLPLLRDVLREI